jgi:hypothetical protein
VVSVDIKGHGNVVSDATYVAAVVPVQKAVVPNGVLGEVEVETAPGNELLGAEAVQAGPGGGAEDTGGQAAGGDGEEVGGVGGGEVGGGGVGEAVSKGEPTTMEDEGRDDTLGFEALGLRGNCCKTPACQVGGVKGEEGGEGVVGGDGRDAHELADPAVGGSGGGREGRAVAKGGLVDKGSDGADDSSWGFDRERGETKATLADRKRQEGNCGPKT